MNTYRVIVSIEVEAKDEDGACREAMDLISDDSMVIESVSSIAEFSTGIIGIDKK